MQSASLLNEEGLWGEGRGAKGRGGGGGGRRRGGGGAGGRGRLG